MPSFYVEARIGLSVGVEITAKSLDEAIEKAKKMVLEDFVDVQGDVSDHNYELTGVCKLGGAPKL